MRLILMRPPGAGEGTQAKVVADHFGVPAISTVTSSGERGRQDRAGREAQRYMDAGSTSPTRSPTRSCATTSTCPTPSPAPARRLPRTSRRSTSSTAAGRVGATLDAAVSLAADQDELVNRLLKRAETEAHRRHRRGDPSAPGEVYNEQTAPLVEVYDERGLLVEVDGIGEVDIVTQRIFDALEDQS